MLVDVVQLDAVEMDELAGVSDALVGEQCPDRFDCLPHREQGFDTVHAHLAGERLPPGTDPEDDAAGRQVVQGRECGRQQGRVPGPVVHHARTHLDPIGDGEKRSHRHRRLPHQAALGLPDCLESLGLRVAGDLHALPDSVRVLQVDGDRRSHD